ncbi:CopG family ribbon-helix-helix protein [Halomarina rubra]|uniref:CopG family ribbon-helix-helix protein n=1 Tax=Halomarina rubra TaxID=2071873 RepID=A0ABD6AYT9_9EURY|nr:ribbon-helix-helix protein, CopG family [Halomarina rubra]
MRTTVNLPEEDLAAFDAVWQAEAIDSRSRAVREAVKEYTEAHARLESLTGEVTAVLAFDYAHHEVIGDLHDVQHDYQDVIQSTSHAHQGEWCLETVFCRGDAERVRELVYELRDFDAVGRVKTLSLSDGGVES